MLLCHAPEVGHDGLVDVAQVVETAFVDVLVNLSDKA